MTTHETEEQQKKQFHDKNDFGAVNYMQIYTWNGSVCCG